MNRSHILFDDVEEKEKDTNRKLKYHSMNSSNLKYRAIKLKLGLEYSTKSGLREYQASPHLSRYGAISVNAKPKIYETESALTTARVYEDKTEYDISGINYIKSIDCQIGNTPRTFQTRFPIIRENIPEQPLFQGSEDRVIFNLPYNNDKATSKNFKNKTMTNNCSMSLKIKEIIPPSLSARESLIKSLDSFILKDQSKRYASLLREWEDVQNYLKIHKPGYLSFLSIVQRITKLLL